MSAQRQLGSLLDPQAGARVSGVSCKFCLRQNLAHCGPESLSDAGALGCGFGAASVGDCAVGVTALTAPLTLLSGSELGVKRAGPGKVLLAGSSFPLGYAPGNLTVSNLDKSTGLEVGSDSEICPQVI